MRELVVEDIKGFIVELYKVYRGLIWGRGVLCGIGT
jgi:hypothetical protein